MADKLMYITNDVNQNYPYCRLQLGIETFEHNLLNQPIKINKSCWANELKNVI